MLVNGLDKVWVNQFGTLLEPIAVIRAKVDAFSRLIAKRRHQLFSFFVMVNGEFFRQLFTVVLLDG